MRGGTSLLFNPVIGSGNLGGVVNFYGNALTSKPAF